MLGSTWSFMVFELVLFPLFYRWNDMRKALLCVAAFFVGVAVLVTVTLYLVPEDAFNATPLRRRWRTRRSASPRGWGSLSS